MGSAAGPHPARTPPAKTKTAWEKTASVAVKIKLKRLGKIRAPYYRIIVADARTKRDGRAIEEIGKYHPKAEPSFIEVDSERAQHWLSVGAQPTDPVRKILEITGDWQKFKGLPGTEGTLRVAAPKESRKDIFAAAVKETLGDSTAPAKGKGRSSSKDSDDKSEKSGKASGKDASSAKADKPARAKASETKASETKASEAKTSEAKASEAKASEAKTSDAKTSDAKAEAKTSEASGKAKSAGDDGAKDKPKATKSAKGGAADAKAEASADAASEPAAQPADSESASGA
jgi:small subunit ribosomal protein S16